MRRLIATAVIATALVCSFLAEAEAARWQKAIEEALATGSLEPLKTFAKPERELVTASSVTSQGGPHGHQ